MRETTKQKQHTVEIATEDGVTCSLICVCGKELSGVTWEQAGFWFDRHQKHAYAEISAALKKALQTESAEASQ